MVMPVSSRAWERGGGPPENVHSIVVNEFLGKVVHDTFNAATDTFRTIALARSELAANLMSLAFCAWTGESVLNEHDRSHNVGKLPNLQARALDILGATGRDSVERFDSRGESRPASVEDRLSGVEASIIELEGRSSR
jgi:hypothetical protein